MELLRCRVAEPSLRPFIAKALPRSQVAGANGIVSAVHVHRGHEAGGMSINTVAVPRLAGCQQAPPGLYQSKSNDFTDIEALRLGETACAHGVITESSSGKDPIQSYVLV